MKTTSKLIKWNNQIKLIFSDVDETIADVYQRAISEMIKALERLLKENRVIFLMSGSGLQSINERIVDYIQPDQRRNILIAPCHGAEVWGFNSLGKQNQRPYYSLYDQRLSLKQKQEFREVAQQLIKEFQLTTFPTMPTQEFQKISKRDPLSIMYVDRGAQITFELVNAYDLLQKQAKKLGVEIPLTNGHYDLRIPIFKRAEQLFTKKNIPITPRLGGVFALDFAVKGVSKTTAIHWFLDNQPLLFSFGLDKNDLLKNPYNMEVWGDKYSTISSGPDKYMSEALPKEVRSIDFRAEDPAELPAGYNIQIWKGKYHLHEGLLEYLQTRS